MAQKIIGLDLGSHEVKVVVLEGGFRGFSVKRLVTAPVPPPGKDEATDEEQSLTDRLLKALEKLVADDPNLFKADGVVTAVPGVLTVTHIITLPFTDTRRIEQTLPFQLEDQIPFDIEDVVFDYQILDQSKGNSEVLVGVVRRETIADLLGILGAVGIDPRVVSLSSLAYQNLYAHGVMRPSLPESKRRDDRMGPTVDPSLGSLGGTGLSHVADAPAEVEAEGSTESATKQPEKSTAEAILDIGHLSTDVCILESGMPRYVRSFQVAGNAMSLAIAQSEQVSFQEAQDLKHEAQSIVEAGDERGIRIARALERGLAPLVRGLRQSLFAFKGRSRAPVARVYLTGGTSRLPGLDKHLERELGCEVLPLEPFPPHIENSLPEEERGNYGATLAMALALRGQGGARTAKITFRKGSFAYKGDLSRLKGVVPRLALIGVLALSLLFVNVMVRFHALSLEQNRVEDQLCELTERVLGACTTFPDDAISRLRGQRAAASIVPQVSAAEILSEVVRRLGRVEGIELRELDIGGSRMRLQGEADSFDAVARVVSELRGYDCFGEVAQGQTRQARQSQKIEFNVDAVLAARCEN